MAFVVEDGSGRSDATSLLSVAEFQTYHDDRGNDYSSYTESQIEQALVQATSYLCHTYSWIGRPTETDQSLAWPRIGAYTKDEYMIDEDEIPKPVKDACAEMGFKALSEEIAPDIDRPIKSFSAGSLAVEWEEGTSVPKTYALVHDMLTGLVRGIGHGTVRFDLV